MSVTHTNPSMASLLRNRFIQTIMTAGVLIQIGIWIRNFAILLFVTEKTNGNALAVSLISVAEFAPIFIFSFIGGTFADRWRPKRTMIWCDLLSALSIFAILLALLFSTWKAVFLATFVSAILSQFSQPSGMKLFKVHVHEAQMQAGMSLFQTMMAVFVVIGPVLGTFVFQQFGIYISMAIVGLAFLFSALVLTLLPPDRIEKADSSVPLWNEMKQGFRYVWSRKVLVILGGGFIAAGFGMGLIQPLSIFLVTERLGMEESYLQWLFAAHGAAMMIGGGLAMAFSHRVAPHILLMMGMGSMAIGIFVIGWSTLFWLTLLAEFSIGLFMPAFHIGMNTIIMNQTDAAFVGRVNGILTPMFMGAMVITMSLSGLLKEQLSLFLIYQISAALFFIGMIIMLPMFRMLHPAKAKS
ncbi:major Facilitator Superfamily protein [Anoxybacillus sp. B7M1]|jgi:MFS transporter, DHA3 family, macrolide efflux protein|uniref:MFS transporter n=1 Tax=Anoxybacillaceae TaxID=3120669 RepID=UPI0005CD79B7|nr:MULTISPECIES: MFS transporter [Anoxybacillus]ANB57722.1 major Facilitator Superfamily protein [Anoxybacillus sp. B2M1]ANB65710.1 major Facilitator Superfamily protein [Anoxybacillus sp. B7M1]QHC04128.1 MFS transporter [Anoxybacillus sp. PDR2]